MTEPTSIPRDEQETTISFMRDDTLISIYTSNRPHLERLRKLANAHSSQGYVKEVRGGDTWGDFTVSAENFRLFSAIRAKRTLTPEQREANAARLAAARTRKDHA